MDSEINETTVVIAENISQITKKAETGDAVAQYLLGKYYYESGEYEKAYIWAQKSSNQLLDRGMNLLGCLFEEGKGVQSDKDRAFALYSEAATKGLAKAQYNLGRCFEDGIGTERNEEKAFELYKMAAENGHAQAQYCVGNCYYDGVGTDISFEKAIIWYEKAAMQGNGNACMNLGHCYDFGIGTKKDGEKAIAWFEKAAASGSGIACFMAGYAFMSGISVDIDYNTALKWFIRADELGYHPSRVMVAWIYSCEIPKSVETQNKVSEWISKALETEDVETDGLLGVFYMNDDSPESRKKAIHYFEKTVGDLPESYSYLSILHFQGGDNEAGIECASKASEAGDPYGSFLMAYSYNTGKGVEKNKKLERFYFKKSIADGFEEVIAIDDLGLIELAVHSELDLSDIGAILLKSALSNVDLFPIEMNTLLNKYVLEVQKKIEYKLKEKKINKDTISGGELVFEKLPRWNPEQSSIITYLNQFINQPGRLLFDKDRYKCARRVLAHASIKGHEERELTDVDFCHAMIREVYPDIGDDAIETIDSRVQELISGFGCSLWYESDGVEKVKEFEDCRVEPAEYLLNHAEELKRLTEFIQGFDNTISNSTNKEVASIFVARMLLYAPKRCDNEQSQITEVRDESEKTRLMVGRFLNEMIRNVSIDEIKGILSNTNHFCADIQWYYDERLRRQKLIQPNETEKNKWQHDDLSSKEICMFLGKHESRFSDTCKNLDNKLRVYILSRVENKELF